MVCELLRQQGWSQTDFQLAHYRDTHGTEVDLIVETPQGIIAVEIKAAMAATPKHLKNLKTRQRRLQWPIELAGGTGCPRRANERDAMSVVETDLLVIGWGKAGKTIAKKVAAAGGDVVLVERSPEMYGGTCINVACVPTKDLVVSAAQRRPEDNPQDYFTHAVADRDSLIGKLNKANYGMLDGQATLVDGTARFTGPREVTVATADGEVVIAANKIIINTGTIPARPPIAGIDLPGVYDSTTIQHADPFPKRLAIIGGGFIGLEFASMFANFGTEVTILDRAEVFVPRLDRDVAAELKTALEAQGVTIRQGVRVEKIEQAQPGVLRIDVGGDGVEAEAVLVAAGRTPATAELELAAAGIETTERGYVKVDERLRTTVDNVWAVGDVNGGPQFTYVSFDDHRIVMDQLTGTGTRTTTDRVAVPTTTFVEPPLSQVGMSPQEAVEAGHSVLYASKKVAAIAAMPRPKILGNTHGVISFTVDAESEKILGATIFSVDSQEVINLVALAIRLGATVADLRDGIWTHPSSTEALNEVLAELAPYDG